jgi:hypothetical protein
VRQQVAKGWQVPFFAVSRSVASQGGLEVACDGVRSLLTVCGPALAAQADSCSKSFQHASVPMMALTLAWRQRLMQASVAAPLLQALDDCLERLMGHFEKFLLERVNSVNRLAAAWPPCPHFFALVGLL